MPLYRKKFTLWMPRYSRQRIWQEKTESNLTTAVSVFSWGYPFQIPNQEFLSINQFSRPLLCVYLGHLESCLPPCSSDSRRYEHIWPFFHVYFSLDPGHDADHHRTLNDLWPGARQFYFPAWCHRSIESAKISLYNHYCSWMVEDWSNPSLYELLSIMFCIMSYWKNTKLV